MARTRPRRRDLWAGWRPNGIGETKPRHYGEILRAIWANRRRLPYAARIVRGGVCDGCALGVAGLHDWTMDGVHLCTTRLALLSTNTMDAADPALLADVAPLKRRSGAELRAMGRLGHPMVRRAGEPGFTRVSWDEALDEVAGARPGGRPAAAGLLPDRARDHQRGLLRRPEGRALPRHQQHRQRRPGLPRALDGGAEAGRGRHRDDDLLPRPDGDRPGRAVGRERRERPAGDDEVPLPGAPRGDAGGGRQPAPRARPRALLGALERRERAARHAHDGRVLPGPRRRRRAPSRPAC